MGKSSGDAVGSVGKKKATANAVAFLLIDRALHRLDGRRLLALGAHLDLETHLLTFLQGLEALGLNFREVREQIVAAIVRSDEAETLCVIEPLNGTSCHITFLEN